MLMLVKLGNQSLNHGVEHLDIGMCPHLLFSEKRNFYFDCHILYARKCSTALHSHYRLQPKQVISKRKRLYNFLKREKRTIALSFVFVALLKVAREDESCLPLMF